MHWSRTRCPAMPSLRSTSRACPEQDLVTVSPQGACTRSCRHMFKPCHLLAGDFHAESMPEAIICLIFMFLNVGITAYIIVRLQDLDIGD